MANNDNSKMVEVAVDLLFYLAENGGSIGPREISRKFDVGTTSAHRIVTSLERKNCLYFDETSQKYKIGYGLIRLIQGNMDNFDAVKISKPHIIHLRDQIGETICLHTMVDNKRIPVYQAESKHELRWTAEIGKSHPIHAGASGKAILAYLDAGEINNIISELDEEVREKILRDLEGIRKDGYTVSYAERVVGGVGIAVPLELDRKAFSISIFAPSSRISEENIDTYTSLLMRTAHEIKSEYLACR